MRVVILTAIPFWHPGTWELMEELSKNGIRVVALDIFHGRKVEPSSIIPENLIPFPIQGVLLKVYMRIFRKRFIRKLIIAGDIVDLHFVEPLYAKYISTLKKNGAKIITSLFGSDLFRTSSAQKELQKHIFDACDAIVLSKNMVSYFETYFPNQSHKYYYNQYGSRRLDIIQKMKLSSDRTKLRQKFNIKEDQIVVTCGYNAKREQQHIAMLEQIEKLADPVKSKLVLLYPLTYGNADAYLNELKVRLSKSGINYQCFESRLSEEELAETKLISDITINTQTTDALANSIKEAMVAGDVLLLGDWLPYDIYLDLGVFFVPASFETLTDSLSDIIGHMDDYKNKSQPNQSIIMNFASWKILVPEWISLYKKVKHGG